MEEGWREEENLPESWMVGEEKATTRGFLKEEYINLGSLKVAVKYLLLHFPLPSPTSYSGPPTILVLKSVFCSMNILLLMLEGHFPNK